MNTCSCVEGKIRCSTNTHPEGPSVNKYIHTVYVNRIYMYSSTSYFFQNACLGNTACSMSHLDRFWQSFPRIQAWSFCLRGSGWFNDYVYALSTEIFQVTWKNVWVQLLWICFLSMCKGQYSVVHFFECVLFSSVIEWCRNNWIKCLQFVFCIWFHSQQLLNPKLVFHKVKTQRNTLGMKQLWEKMFLVNACNVSQEHISHHPQNGLKHACKIHFSPGGTVAAICITVLPHALQKEVLWTLYTSLSFYSYLWKKPL